MELQDQLQGGWSRYLHDRPPADFDGSSVKMVGSPADPYCSMWMEAERAAFRNCGGHSFAMNARLRLESLKSGYNPASPRCVIGGLLDKYKHPCDGEGSQEEESILDSVELLDVEDDSQDEESWLYRASKGFDNRGQSALGWCRHVLDNPSPETEAARRSLIYKLQHCSNRYLYMHPAVFHPRVSAASPVPQTPDSTAHRISDLTDHSGLNPCGDATNSSYKLQDITDVHIVARMQEASLRHDYISTPASGRGPEPSAAFPSYFDTTEEPVQLKSEPPPPCWRPAVPSLSPPYQSSPPKHGCQSPRLSRLQQQVTQFKLMKLAQNQGTSTVQTRPPLRTSLRSLQAVRNSRSLDTDDYQPAEPHFPYPPSGGPCDLSGSRFWSPSLTAVSAKPMAAPGSARNPDKRLQRSQSASPGRIPQSLANARVFASPGGTSSPAWARLSNQR